MEWISVKDGLPKDDGYYLVFGEWDNVSKAYYVEQTFIEEDWVDNSKNITKYITHWMPLPEPPKD